VIVADNKPYTTQLQAGLGLVNETKTLLDLWSPGMSANQLHQVALESGRFPPLPRADFATSSSNASLHAISWQVVHRQHISSGCPQRFPRLT
jgi:hypothetical protein